MWRAASLVQAATAAVCALITGFSCLPVDTAGDPSWPEQVLSSTPGAGVPAGSALTGAVPGTPVGQFFEQEPNNSFEAASPVPFLESVELLGAIGGTTPADIDVFYLGPAAAGDRLNVDLDIPAGSTVILGVYDERQRLIAYLNRSSPVTGPPAIDLVLRADVAGLHVAVSARSASAEDRPYAVRLSLTGPQTVPAGVPQALVLSFAGRDQVRIGSRLPVNVPPFDAGRIDPRFAGQTETIIRRVVELVGEDYAGLNVSIHTDIDRPAGPHSTVYFGTYDAALLGLADNIDPYNAAAEQAAIVYTDTFSLFGRLNPDVEAISQVLANVASHEAGHLLGLRHTADPQDIMDVTASARQMMLDQDFKLGRLDASVMPLGFQDAPTLLSWTVGGALPAVRKLFWPQCARTADDIAPQEDDFFIPRDLLSSSHDEASGLDDGSGMP